MLIVIAADVVVPSILRSEPSVVPITSVRPLTVPVRSSVPPLAVIVPAVEIGTATVPKPEMLVFAATLPDPTMDPPASVKPAASVSCVAPAAASSFNVLAPSVSAFVSVRLAAVLSSSVPAVPKNVADVAVLAPSSFSVSPLALPMCRPPVVLATVPFSSSVPPVAVIECFHRWWSMFAVHLAESRLGSHRRRWSNWRRPSACRHRAGSCRW